MTKPKDQMNLDLLNKIKKFIFQKDLIISL